MCRLLQSDPPAYYDRIWFFFATVHCSATPDATNRLTNWRAHCTRVDSKKLSGGVVSHTVHTTTTQLIGLFPMVSCLLSSSSGDSCYTTIGSTIVTSMAHGLVMIAVMVVLMVAANWWMLLLRSRLCFCDADKRLAPRADIKRCVGSGARFRGHRSNGGLLTRRTRFNQSNRIRARHNHRPELLACSC